MFPIKVNGKKHQIPERWEEVSFKTFCDLIKAKGDEAKVISALLGLPEDEVKNSKIQGLDILFLKMSFLKEGPEIQEIPTKLGPYKFPKDIGFETIKQFEQVRSEIAATIPKDMENPTPGEIYLQTGLS